MNAKPTRTPKLTGLTIKALLDGGARTTLVVHADGKLDTPDLSEETLPPTSRIVLTSEGTPANRRWADALLVLATDSAHEDGTSTALGTLRAAAARLANDELLEVYQGALAAWQAAQDAAQALQLATTPPAAQVVPTPPVRPALAVLPRPRGRHAAPRSEATREAETHALCALLDELDDADLLRAS